MEGKYENNNFATAFQLRLLCRQTDIFLFILLSLTQLSDCGPFDIQLSDMMVFFVVWNDRKFADLSLCSL